MTLPVSRFGYSVVAMAALAVGCAAGDAGDGDGAGLPIGNGADDAGGATPVDADARVDAGASGIDAGVNRDSAGEGKSDAAGDATASLLDSGAVTTPDACAAAVELCNAKDDNCDGRIDTGCPQNATLGATEASAPYGGGGGSAFDGSCPAGQALIGFDGRSGDRLDAVAPVCAVIELEAVVVAPELEYRVRTRAVTIQSQHGGTGGGVFSDRCGTDEVVIGLSGRSGANVDLLAFSCGSVTMKRVSGVYAPVITGTRSSATHGGSGGSAFSYACSDGRIASGVIGRSGDKVDALSLTCALASFSTTL